MTAPHTAESTARGKSLLPFNASHCTRQASTIPTATVKNHRQHREHHGPDENGEERFLDPFVPEKRG